jgi:hypothetical protein
LSPRRAWPRRTGSAQGSGGEPRADGGLEPGANRAETKVSGTIPFHARLKTQPAGKSRDERARLLARSGVDGRDLEAERCALHVRAPLSGADAAELASKGIEVATWAWIPPVPDLHPHGDYLARVCYASLEPVDKDDRIVRLYTVETRLRRLNDLAGELVNPRAVHDGIGVTARMGLGVRLAVADSGLDVTHADFATPAAAFDVTTGTSPSTRAARRPRWQEKRTRSRGTSGSTGARR